MKRYHDERRATSSPSAGEGPGRLQAADALADVRAALGAFRVMTRQRLDLAHPLDSFAVAVCSAKHFAVLACMHAEDRAPHRCAGHVLQAIQHESRAVGASGPLKPALLRLLGALGAFDRSTLTEN